jgi:hypothetical protein
VITPKTIHGPSLDRAIIVDIRPLVSRGGTRNPRITLKVGPFSESEDIEIIVIFNKTRFQRPEPAIALIPDPV